MKRRFLQDAIIESLTDTPAVFIRGARQAGKTTLARMIADEIPNSRYYSLDDPLVLSQVTEDASALFDEPKSMVVIDEIQRAPEFLMAIKNSIDRHRRPGRFLLTGSADILTLPRVSESLAGRMEVHTLRPFSQGEIEGNVEAFIDAAFSGSVVASPAITDRDDIWSRVIRGGFPEVLSRETPERRDAWFSAYVTTILQREVRDISNIVGLRELPRLLQLLAHRTATLMNVAEISRSLGISHSTLTRYLAILESVFLFQPQAPWSGHATRRLVRASKVHLSDTGVSSNLSGLTEARLAAEPRTRGPALESFVFLEIQKQVAWSRTKPAVFYYRDHRGSEVDLLLEDRSGRIVAIEIKSTSNPSGRDLDPIHFLSREMGDRFVAGFVLHTGGETTSLGAKLQLLPVSALWATT